MENTDDSWLYLSELVLEFDFGAYELKSIGGMVAPRENKFLGKRLAFSTKRCCWQKIYTLKYHMHEYINNQWVDLGYYSSDKQYFISVYPTPLYRVFVSRDLSREDRAIGDPIAEIIKEWGFETITVGIEVEAPEEQVPLKVKEKIKKCDALVAIATSRYRDALTGLWRTLEWLHGEVEIAFGIDKPLLTLKDKRVSLGGLPGCLSELKQTPIIEFDPYNLDEHAGALLGSSKMMGFAIFK